MSLIFIIAIILFTTILSQTNPFKYFRKISLKFIVNTPNLGIVKKLINILYYITLYNIYFQNYFITIVSFFNTT